jgi:hypothetical protein
VTLGSAAAGARGVGITEVAGAAGSTVVASGSTGRRGMVASAGEGGRAALPGPWACGAPAGPVPGCRAAGAGVCGAFRCGGMALVSGVPRVAGPGASARGGSGAPPPGRPGAPSRICGCAAGKTGGVASAGGAEGDGVAGSASDAFTGCAGGGGVAATAGEEGCPSPVSGPVGPASISTYGRIRSGSKSSAAATCAVRASRRASEARWVQAQAGVLSRCLGAPHSGHGWPFGGSTRSSLPSRTPEIIQIFSTVRARSPRNHGFQKGPAGHNRSQRSRWKMSQVTREVLWPGTGTPPR